MPRSFVFAVPALLATLALTPVLPPAYAAPEAMLPVATIAMPGGTDSSGSAGLAFDGEVFYYLTGDSRPGGLHAGRVERLRLTGSGATLAAVPLAPLDLGGVVLRITYDARHRALLAESQDPSGAAVVRRVDLRTGRARTLFRFTDSYLTGFAYEWSTDRFVTMDDFQGLVTLDARGHKVRTCPLSSEIVTLGPSAFTGGGTDDVYIQAEDDSTTSRVGADCTERGTFAHRTTAEATSEDDALACDAVTFPQPVMWIRDTNTLTMTAYTLPSGACVLPTALSVTAKDGRVCATLRRAEVAVPLAARPVTIRVDDRTVTATTGATGRACDPHRHGPGHHRVTASFAGTRAWTAASARTAFTIAAPPAAPKPPVRPASHPRRLLTIDRRPGAVAPIGTAGLPAAPPPVAPHAAAQQAYGTTTATQAVPGAVPVPQAQREGQVVYAMTGLDRRTEPGLRLLGAAVVTTMAAGFALRRATAAQGVSAGR